MSNKTTLTYINPTLPHSHSTRSYPKKAKNMGDLHSLPYFNSLLPHNIHRAFSYHPMNMNETSPFLMHADNLSSSGYLEDALFEFRSKRRRLILFHDDQPQPIYQNSITPVPSYCNPKSPENIEECLENFCKFYSGDDDDNGEERKVKGRGIEETNSTSSSETTKSSINGVEQDLLSSHHYSLFPGGKNEERKRKHITRVVYPFALVKPGGFKGDITLKDINQRILMPPTRPLKHPVGDFACQPLVSPGGPGLSGKAVVALTRIHTQGRGTITIIRTKN